MDKKHESYLKEYFPQLSFMKRWTIDDDTYFRLGQSCAIADAVRALPLAPMERMQLMQVSLIKGAQATTAIEGNTLSVSEIDGILNGKSMPESRKYLETEVKNVIDAMNDIGRDILINNSSSYITNELILRCHRAIGKDLGDNFAAIPGQYRQNNVEVGTYRAPDNKYVKWLMTKLMSWLQEEFCYRENEQPDFIRAIIESMVAHVYIAWIHPFGDGNGRTARLIEFYILLRCGLPDICCHILSNHYNQTRNEYYRLLHKCRVDNDLSSFIKYGVNGLLDGLQETLREVGAYQIKSSWTNFIHTVCDSWAGINGPIRKRLRDLVLGLKIGKEYEKNELCSSSPAAAAAYANKGIGTINRDLKILQKMELVIQSNGKYKANIKMLIDSRLPRSRCFD